MIFWYDDLYMDHEVAKDEKKCKKIIEERCRYKSGLRKKLSANCAPWKPNYELVLLANNKENLFEIMNTKQMFFSYYQKMDLFVIGVASHYEGAVEIVREILENGYREDASFDPRKQFTREHFSGR